MKMKNRILLGATLALLWLSRDIPAQQTYNPPVRFLSGTAAPASTDCDAAGERAALYIQTGDPATISTRVLACTQTGASTYAWSLVSHKSGTTAPTDCVTGDIFFDSDAAAGLNWYGCTATDTWTLQGDGAGGAPTTASYIVISLDGTLSAERTIAAGAGIGGTDGGANGAYTLATASSELDFLISGALTCGASTRGKIQVHTTPLQYCDNAGTPALQYAAYGDSAGASLSGDSATAFFTTGAVEEARIDAAIARDTEIILGVANLTTTGAVPFVSATSTLNQDASLNWDSTNNILAFPVLDITTSTEETCDSTARGRTRVVEGGAGVADTLRICLKDSADAYAWRPLQ